MSKTVLSLQKNPAEPVDDCARMNKLAHAAFGREVLRKVSDVILPLNDTGTGPAFYCVHPITGAATNFRVMAQMLGSKQRFYGIQTPTKKRTAEFASSIEAIGEFYVEHLVRFQPAGSFILGGHSVGALIALEMAQQLRSRGRTVSLLVVFDGEIFNTGTEISALTPLYWLKVAANVPAWIRDFLMVEFTLRKFCRTVLNKMIGTCKTIGAKMLGEKLRAGHAVEGFVDLKDFTPDHIAFMKMLFEIQYAYVPKQYSGAVLVCAAKTQSLSYLRQIEAAWRKIAPAVEIVSFNGTHTSIIQIPKGIIVAEHLTRRIAEARREPQNWNGLSERLRRSGDTDRFSHGRS
jgi:thioesterase domain-containing protein